MRELLSGALPAPQDEPPPRDVIDAAMDWGTRRRRRDWALSGAAALAVIAVGTGVAAMSGGSGDSVSTGAGPRPSSAYGTFVIPPPQSGNWPTPSCRAPDPLKKNLAQYCKLFNEQQDFNLTFVKGSVPYIQAALPSGFTVKTSRSWMLVLTAPNGKTNYLFPSVEPASTLGGQPPGCGTPVPPSCIQTSAAGGMVVVNSAPSGEPSAGYVGKDLKDPRVDILLGTSAGGGMDGVAPPTSAEPLLSNPQLAKVLSDPGFLAYAKAQFQHLTDITRQLQAMAPPSMSSSGPTTAPPTTAISSWPSGPSGYPTGTPITPGSPPTAGWSTSGDPSGSLPAQTESSWAGSPSGTPASPGGQPSGITSSGSQPSVGGAWSSPS